MAALTGGLLLPGRHRLCSHSLPRFAAPRCVRAVRVVAMAKPTKASDLRSLSEEEILRAITESERALLDLRIAQKTRKAFKGSEFPWHKTKIAQLKTILRERQIEQGIGRREARRLEKKKMLDAGFGQF